MYILLTDETNREPSVDVKFFVYGGIFFSIEKLSLLNLEIANIRERVGYKPGDEFKFNTLSRPKDVSIEEFTAAKNDVIELCLEQDVKFIAYVILHDIIRRKSSEEKITMAANNVIGRFNYFLSRQNEDGICIIDNLPENGQWNYLAEKFQEGLYIQEENRTVPLERIQFFGATCINAAHVNSAMDIILGAFRYCINNPRNPDAASAMMRNVASMMWGREDGDTRYLRDYGFILRPITVKAPAYQKEYDLLIEHIASLTKFT